MKKRWLIFIGLVVFLSFGNCSSLPEKPPTREPIPDFEIGCQKFRGTERNRCIQNLLKELEDLRNPDREILKTEISRERYSEYWVRVETRYCLSSDLCFVDSNYEYKPTFMAKMKEYGVIGGIVLIGTLLLGG
jgi:hypothetical protein